MEETKAILDSSAILAMFFKEKNWSRVKKILQNVTVKKKEVFVSLLSVGEVYYKIWDRRGEEDAKKVLALLKRWPVKIVGIEEEVIIEAAGFKRQGLAFVDSIIAATTDYYQGILITADYDFKILAKKIKIIWI